MLRLNVNGKDVQVDDAADDTPLLWVLRDHLKLVGTSTDAASRNAEHARSMWTAYL